jgi:hypothetical protein
MITCSRVDLNGLKVINSKIILAKRIKVKES